MRNKNWEAQEGQDKSAKPSIHVFVRKNFIFGFPNINLG